MSTAITNTTRDLRALLNSDAAKAQFAAALPKHLTPERFCRVAITALTRTPKLADCTQESLFKCLLDLSALGIEPDGRRAHLIPYGKECTLILDYKGIAELAMRSGDVSSIHADKVCDRDVFRFNLGKVEQHVIDFKTERGESYAYYCIVRFKDGCEKHEVMSRREVEVVRKRSRAGNAGPWVTDFDEMAKKTVFRRASKWLPLSPEIRDAFDSDGDELPPIRNVTPAAPVLPLAVNPFSPPEPEPAPAPEQPADDEILM